MASSNDPRRKKLTDLAEKHMRSQLHARFLEECCAESIVPKGLKLKLTINVGNTSQGLQASINRLLDKVSIDICGRIKEEHIKKAVQLSEEIETIRSGLSDSLTSDQIAELDSEIYTRTTQKQGKIIEQHKKKLAHLKMLQCPDVIVIEDDSHPTVSNTNFCTTNSQKEGSDTGYTKVLRKKSNKNNNNKNEVDLRSATSKFARHRNNGAGNQISGDRYKFKGNRKNSYENKGKNKLASNNNNTTTNRTQKDHTNQTLRPRNISDVSAGEVKQQPTNQAGDIDISDNQPKNLHAPGTRKTYAEATRNGASQVQDINQLQNQLRRILELVQSITTTPTSQKENPVDSSGQKTETCGKSLRKGSDRSKGVKRRF